MMRAALTLCFALLCALLPAIAKAEYELSGIIGTGPRKLVLRSNADLDIMQPAISGFVARHPEFSVEYEQWTANGLYRASRDACRKGQRSADVVFSSAVQQMIGLVNSGCARPYQSERTRALPVARRWRDELWGLTEEPAVIIYNKRMIAPEDVPRDRFALLDMMRNTPALSGRIATYDIEQSGLGYLFAYGDSLEATTFGGLLEGFARSGAIVTCCSAQIIEDVSTGRYALAYNVLGSYALSYQNPDLGMILPEDYTLFLSRAYMIPKRAQDPQGAEMLLDFLLAPEGQTALAKAGLVFPDDPQENGLLPSSRRFIDLSPALIVALDRHTRQRFSQVWDETFTPAIHE